MLLFLQQFQDLTMSESIYIPLIIYVFIETIIFGFTKSWFWLIRRVCQWWREIVYLGNLIRYRRDNENRFVQWSQKLRYVPLQAIQARTSEGNVRIEPLIDLLE